MHGGVGLCSCRHLVDGLPGTSARYERRLVVTPCAVETVGSVMHGGVGLCSCRHLVDEVCEGPVVPVTLVVNITEFEVARARGFGGLALERGEERVAL